MIPTPLRLLYDRQCPVCEAYCRRVSALAGAGTLELVDARADSALLRAVTARGLDIDQGMVLEVGGELHYGAEAIAALADISGRTGVVNRLSRLMFGSARRARLLYPALRAMRNLLLKALRRRRINNLGRAGAERF